jgi:hypothetical protein
MLDFTGNLGHAFTFAAASSDSPVGGIGRIAVVPARPFFQNGGVDLSTHAWAERAQRQAAFGLLTSGRVEDLKSPLTMTNLDIHWYEFPIADSDREFFKEKYEELVSLYGDPSAGFLRYHITEFVEGRGKLSLH